MITLHSRLPIVLFGLIFLVACDTDTDSNNPDQPGSARAEAAGLFSEQLHDLPMPPPGYARVEFQGQVHEAAFYSDCSANLDPPPDDQPWEPHSFSAYFSTRTDDQHLSIDVVRTIHLHEEAWASAPREHEIVSVTTTPGGETIMYTYTMYRKDPGSAAMISRPLEAQAQRARSTDTVPGIRVHPDGHQASFVGLLGRSSMIEDIVHDESEEISIAIHCGPV